MRLTTIFTWSPENAEAVYERFEAFGNGDAPKEVQEAFSSLKVIAWEKLATNEVVTIAEGDEFALAIWNGYWQDLGDFQLVMPSFDMTDEDVLAKITPPPFARR